MPGSVVSPVRTSATGGFLFACVSNLAVAPGLVLLRGNTQSCLLKECESFPTREGKCLTCSGSRRQIRSFSWWLMRAGGGSEATGCGSALPLGFSTASLPGAAPAEEAQERGESSQAPAALLLGARGKGRGPGGRWSIARWHSSACPRLPEARPERQP